MIQRTTALASAPIVQASAEIASPTPWCIPTGEQNGFIICSGDNPEKPGPILMVLRTPYGRKSFLTDADINANTSLIVEAVNGRQALLARIARLEADLLECREYLETEMDVIDGDYGIPAPNRAMALVTMIDESLHVPGVF